MLLIFKERLMHLPFDFIFDRVMVPPWCKRSGGAWCNACSAFIFCCRFVLFCDCVPKYNMYVHIADTTNIFDTLRPNRWREPYHWLPVLN